MPPVPSRPSEPPDPTRSRLLHAAAEIFGHVGFRRATVRDICARANANIAAVNYHFGDKEGLYAEAVKSGFALGLEKYPIDMGVPPDPAPEQRLHGFVRSFLYRTLGRGDHTTAGRIMLWEMVEPTPVLEALFQDRIRFLYLKLESIVQDLLGPAANPQRIAMGCASVLGQCTFYRMAEPLLSKIQSGPTTNLPPDRIEPLAEHITRLTAAGLRDYELKDEG